MISPLGDDDGARFKRGLLVHRLLQSLPDLPESEREAAARAFLGRPALGLGKAEAEEMLTETLRVLADPEHADLFGPGSLSEVPVTGTIGAEGSLRTLSGQVDRLLVTEDAVTVIDFKTNRPPPQTEDQVAPVYLRQMASYREALRRVYPDRPVHAVLLWTVGPRLMPLSDQILDAFAP